MSQYIITIVPVSSGDADVESSKTVVHIDTDEGKPAVREVNIHAPEGASLVGRMPYIDFEMLLRAFVPDAGAPDPVATGVGRQRRSRQPAAARTGDRPVAREAATPPATRKNRRVPPQAAGLLGAGRAYRRAPSLAELEAAYSESGTITGVATRFGVPVHTAQGWISRMRRQLDSAED